MMTYHRALLLLAVLLSIATINVTFMPLRHRMLVTLEVRLTPPPKPVRCEACIHVCTQGRGKYITRSHSPPRWHIPARCPAPALCCCLQVLSLVTLCMTVALSLYFVEVDDLVSRDEVRRWRMK